MDISAEVASAASTTSEKVSIFIDAHFHLDRAAKAMLAGQEGHWTDQVRTVLHQRESAAKLGKCVASFCDSATHAELVANPEILTELAKDPRLYFSFGVHPKAAERWVKERTPNGVTLDAARLLNLRRLLGEVPKVVGIGEMGLDFSVGNGERWDVQRLVMEQVLEATPTSSGPGVYLLLFTAGKRRPGPRCCSRMN
jgi:Tat protein secretion system quality control protein TatD with DNase activity